MFPGKLKPEDLGTGDDEESDTWCKVVLIFSSCVLPCFKSALSSAFQWTRGRRVVETIVRIAQEELSAVRNTAEQEKVARIWLV